MQLEAYHVYMSELEDREEKWILNCSIIKIEFTLGRYFRSVYWLELSPHYNEVLSMALF